MAVGGGRVIASHWKVTHAPVKDPTLAPIEQGVFNNKLERKHEVRREMGWGTLKRVGRVMLDGCDQNILLEIFKEKVKILFTIKISV